MGDRLTDLTLRRARLACLHELLAARRATVDSINAELRTPKLEAAA